MVCISEHPKQIPGNHAAVDPLWAVGVRERHSVGYDLLGEVSLANEILQGLSQCFGAEQWHRAS